MSNILVFAGVQNGAALKSGLEALGTAVQLATQTGGTVGAVAVGDGAAGAAAELIAGGAATVYVADDKALADYQPDIYVAAVAAAVQQSDPAIVLVTNDPTGKDLAPRLAYSLGAGVVSDVTAFTVKDGQIQWTRPVYGGKAEAVYSATTARQVAALRPRAFAAATPDAGRTGEIVKLGVTLDPATAATRVAEHIREAVSGIRLEDAKVVISGGRGLGGPEGFKDLEKLAQLLGGAVGASRAACDAGWVPAGWQVGQTGKMVAPDLYIAIGISGASQHLAGITNAKTVVALNKDPEAPIFKRADLGIVADWKQVFPHLLEACQQLLGS